MQPTAEKLPAAQTPELNQELRIQTDTATWLAETLHGSMRTEFEFSYDGRELRGEDGGSLDPIFDDAIEEAAIMADRNPSMLFELRRRLMEREELDEMYGMAQGNRPNTTIVISDFPPELMSAAEDVGGYNVSRQQTMMRIITFRDGKINVVSQSLDGSNREATDAIYAAMGETPEEGELLGQRIHRDLPPEWQDNLADNLRNVYDGSMAEQFGGEWYAGINQRPDRNIVNTYGFATGQQDLIEWFTREKLADSVGAEKHRYKLAATAKARHERYLKRQNTADSPARLDAEYSSFVTVRSIGNAKGLIYEMTREGSRAAARGDVFSGCGATLESDTMTEDQLSSSGYGNKSASKSEDGECEFVSKECPECHEKDVKTTVTKTHISGSCGCSVRRKPKQAASV
jgi:hypothetical protein